MNIITFNIDKYNGLDNLMKDVSNTMSTLVKNGYDIEFRYDDCGIYALLFDYQDIKLATDILTWLTPEEYEDFLIERSYKSDIN